MDEVDVNRAITRIAHEIIEKNKGVENLILIGIQRRGARLVYRIRDAIEMANETYGSGFRIPVGILDITFYRDDLSLLSEHPVFNGTDIDFQIDGKKIILVDDVIFTGRTIRAAIDALFDIGRPKAVQLAVLIDRGHRELPFKPDYTGKNVPTSRQEEICVQFKEIDGIDTVQLIHLKT
ncbi:MAG: bifunctional pyr operon transcriptional regulator/uracil phosphoribosyltransferase PyrR [Clostridiales bacterium]|nr:bifunctional pyr operon transcriptional regulator/uracil phosphoribosyltransferase PyrR [Clostridiales bacterium]